MPVATYPHLEIRHDGKLMIVGTGIKVIMLIGAHIAYRWDAEQLQVQYPQLTMGQIHSALGYYYDHKDEMDRELEQRRKDADEFLESLPQSDVREKLRARARR